MRGLLVLVITAFFLTSCSNQPENTTEDKQILRLNIYTEPPSLDPGRATDTTSAEILRMLFDGLMRLGPSQNPEPAVAETVDISEDGKTYTFKLRESAWNTGDPVTAHDFAYAWKRVLDPKFPGELAYELYVIKNAKPVKEGKLPMSALGVQAVDDHTLIVELEHPAPYFLEQLAAHTFLPLHAKTVQNNPDWAYDATPAYVSNGPFRMTQWKHHNELVVDKSPTYWDQDSVKLNQIKLSMIEDVNTELSLFEKGDLDWTGKPVSIGLPTDAIPALDRSGRLQKHGYASVYLYLLNTKHKPFNNANFRRALAYAVNRKSITDNILQGGEQIATGLVSPPMQVQSTPYFHDADVAEAQRLFDMALKELRLSRQKLPKLTISYNTSEAHHKIAQAIQQQWRAVLGLEVAVENAEWKVYLDNITQGHFDIARMSWRPGFNDAISFLDLFKYADGKINHTGWSDPKYTALLNEADFTTDPAKRRELLQQAEALLIQAMPFIPIYFNSTSYLINPHLKGVYFSPIGEVDFKWAYFEPGK